MPVSEKWAEKKIAYCALTLLYSKKLDNYRPKNWWKCVCLHFRTMLIFGCVSYCKCKNCTAIHCKPTSLQRALISTMMLKIVIWHHF